MKAYKVVTKRNGKCAISYCCSTTEYKVGKPTLCPEASKPLFCFLTLESAIDFVMHDWEDADNKYELIRKYAVYECEIEPSSVDAKMVICWPAPYNTVMADSVTLKKKVFDFAIDNFEDIIDNQVIKIDNKALKLVLDDVERYELTYEKDGYNEVYSTSGAIERDENKVVVYAFGKGVRSFKWNKILSIKRINA